MTGRGAFHLLAVSAVVMGMAQTIAKEKVFEWLRVWLGGKDTWLGYLVSCPYCVSHWLAFILVPLTGAYYVEVAVGGWFGAALRWFLSSILIVTITAFLRVAFWFVDESQGLVRRRNRTEEEETRLRRLERAKLQGEVANEAR
jgi:hypothetical protein